MGCLCVSVSVSWLNRWILCVPVLRYECASRPHLFSPPPATPQRRGRRVYLRRGPTLQGRGPHAAQVHAPGAAGHGQREPAQLQHVAVLLHPRRMRAPQGERASEARACLPFVLVLGLVVVGVGGYLLNLFVSACVDGSRDRRPPFIMATSGQAHHLTHTHTHLHHPHTPHRASTPSSAR